jgi:rubrerythrin
MLFALLRPPASASSRDPEWKCRIWSHRALEQRFNQVESMAAGGAQAKISGDSQMKVRQALVCGDCGAIIEDEHLPEEEDWTCPECGRGSNLELTWVINLGDGHEN